MLKNEGMIRRRGASQSATFVVAASDSLHRGYADYVCDGVDDQVEIQAAIDALPSGGGEVLLLEGIYNIASSIELVSNSHIHGQGAATILRGTAELSNLTISISHKNNVIVSDLQIDGSLASSPTMLNDGINSSSSSDVIIERCFVYGEGDDAVDIDGGSMIIVNDCILGDNGGAGVHISQLSPEYIVVSNCISYNNGAIYNKEGFDVYDGAEAASLPSGSRIIFANCISINDNIGIHLCGEYNKAIGCIVYNSTGVGISITANHSASAYCEVIGCSVYGAGENGISVDGNNHTVSGNNVKGVTNCGIYCGGSNSIVSSNIVVSPGNIGIETLVTSSDLVISNNNVVGATGGGISIRGTGSAISANEIEGGVYGIGVRGSYNSVVGNQIKSVISALYGCIWVTDNYVTIQGNMLMSGARAGIFLDGGQYASIVGNIISDNAINGITFSNYDYVTIDSNNILSNTNDGILIDIDSDDISISNNKILNNTHSGIEATGISNGKFVGNECRGNTGRGFDFYDITSCIISNNQIRSNGTTGMALDSLCSNNIIRNNIILNNPTISIDDAGIENLIWDKYSDIFMDVLAASAIHVRSNEDLSATVPITFTIDAQPDVPRTLSGHFDTHANITAYTIDIVGVDAKGNTVTETKTEADGWDWETNNAFATITSITMSSRTGTGTTDTMDIGITDVLGLSNVIYETGDVFKIKKDNANATVAGAQVNTTYDTYDMSVIGLAATNDFTIWYKSNLNIIS